MDPTDDEPTMGTVPKIGGSPLVTNTTLPAVNASETRQPLVIGVTLTALFLASIVAALRIYVRRWRLRRWGPDDTALVFSYVLVFVTGLLMLINTRYGDGLHKATLTRENYLKTQEIAIAAVAVYQAAMPLIKSTFLLQYRRVFPLPPFQKLCNIFLIFIMTFGFTQVVSLCFACVPLRALWDFSVKGKCFKLLDWWYAGSAINLITDIIIFVMPVPLLRTLAVPLRQKIVLMATFGLGFFTCAISVIRLTTLKSSATSTDPTYNTVVAGIWSITELCCAIICVCIPTLRPLLGTQSLSPVIKRTYVQRNLEDSADTELYTQSDGATTSQKRRSRPVSHASQHAIENVESPRVVDEYARSLSGVTIPPAIHIDEAHEARTELRTRDTFKTREELKAAMTMTLPLTRVDTDDGVEFLMLEAPGHEPELPTPLKPPPRRHTDRGNRQSQGDYFGAVVWESSGEPKAEDSTDVSPKDQKDGPS
ncbi:Satratoxin biosynthesis SC1 cluster protein 4 [Colletotrichum siamense]|uniref:Satratoxin biosynthesis SC1 cluster protein 4 n=1 Tax=Colletotrichum siamense TaxID=690259 RepID=A0A9P5EVX3_COLSI|nr:Satratoxin biosynthesis SC1 cluster protein 4 [Colletotrichum siamense]KAF4861169.1 Satratoxin biosynthesis SC1 cluster protein 4 [Colletotrichum siamense]